MGANASDRKRCLSRLFINQGNLHRHTGIMIQNQYLIFGGQSRLDCSSDMLYIYDFETQTFRKSESQFRPPKTDSHSACEWKVDLIIQNPDGDDMLIFGGYQNDKNYKFSNDIFKYNVKTDSWKLLTENLSVVPPARQGSALAVINNFAYIFGGTKNNQKLDDMWRFDLKNLQWQ